MPGGSGFDRVRWASTWEFAVTPEQADLYFSIALKSLRDRRLAMADCRVLSFLMSQPDWPTRWPSRAYIAKSINLSAFSVGRGLRKLQSFGYIKRPYAIGDFVYFMRAGDFVKIGKSTGNPASRLSSLKTGCPFPIEVIATIPGGLSEERGLHKKFSHIRAHGEWFHATEELLTYAADIASTEVSP